MPENETWVEITHPASAGEPPATVTQAAYDLVWKDLGWSLGGAEGSGSELDSEPVPEGSAAEILAWVGDDEDRAQRARAAEETKPSPRSGLLSSLASMSTVKEKN